MAQQIWDRRYEFVFTTETHDLGKCLDIAEAEDSKPIIIADSGDNPTAGASEDLTNVLAELLKRSTKNVLVAVIADKDSYARCLEAGGSYIDLELGRVNPTERSRPLGMLTLGSWIGQGIPAAVLKIDDIKVIVTAERTGVYDRSSLLIWA